MNLRIFTFNLTSSGEFGILYNDVTGNTHCLFCSMTSLDDIYIRRATSSNSIYFTGPNYPHPDTRRPEKDITHEFIEDFRYNAILEAVENYLKGTQSNENISIR